MRRLVFVCADNACASPYAERRAQALGFIATSCGLDAASGGIDAPTMALSAASGRGIGLIGHRARSFDAGAVTTGDLLIAFEPAHCARVAALVGRSGRAQVALLALGERALSRETACNADVIARCYARIDQGLAALRRDAVGPHEHTRPRYGHTRTGNNGGRGNMRAPLR